MHDTSQNKALYIPPPWQRDQGQPIVEVDDAANGCSKSSSSIPTMAGLIPVAERTISVDTQMVNAGTSRRRFKDRLPRTETLERVASSMFVVGPSSTHGVKAQSRPLDQPLSQQLDLPELSSHATIGRNSQFHNLTAEDREVLGGIEYRSLKLLFKIVTGKSAPRA